MQKKNARYVVMRRAMEARACVRRKGGVAGLPQTLGNVRRAPLTAAPPAGGMVGG